MPHFVALPLKGYVQTPDPNLASLSIDDSVGAIAIGVWAAGRDWTVRTRQNARSVSTWFREERAVGVFMLRGLLTGDEIAGFDAAGAQQTAWLPVKRSAGDKGASVVRKSASFPRVLLDARTSRQGFTPMKEEDWLAWVERCIVYIRKNAVGKAMTDFLPDPITIMPFLPNDTNADAQPGPIIRFTPATFGGKTAAGGQPNEVLFHEFCHVIDGFYAGYFDNATYDFQYNNEEFFSVNCTNVYASIYKRPLRRDYPATKPMSAALSGPDGPGLMLTINKKNFEVFRSIRPNVYQILGDISASWNPFSPSVTPMPIGPSP